MMAPRRGSSRPAPGRRHRLLRGVAGDRFLRIAVAPGFAEPPLIDHRDVAGRGEAKLTRTPWSPAADGNASDHSEWC